MNKANINRNRVQSGLRNLVHRRLCVVTDGKTVAVVKASSTEEAKQLWKAHNLKKNQAEPELQVEFVGDWPASQSVGLNFQLD